MQLSQNTLNKTLDTYRRAWEGQDSDLIPTIFTETATYHERVHEEPIRGRTGIRDYWNQKVVREQANIRFSVLNTYIDGQTAIPEWDAQFDDLIKRKRRHMKEVAILVFEDGKIASLREYWSTVDLADLAP